MGVAAQVVLVLMPLPAKTLSLALSPRQAEAEEARTAIRRAVQAGQVAARHRPLRALLWAQATTVRASTADRDERTPVRQRTGLAAEVAEQGQ